MKRKNTTNVFAAVSCCLAVTMWITPLPAYALDAEGGVPGEATEIQQPAAESESAVQPTDAKPVADDENSVPVAEVAEKQQTENATLKEHLNARSREKARAIDTAAAESANSPAVTPTDKPEEAESDEDAPKLPDTVATVDNRSDHIVLNLFDYPNGADRTGVNHYTDYYFRNPLRFRSWMSDYTSGRVVQGIVKDRLGEDGYPVLNSEDERSMAYLFSPDLPEDGKIIYADVSHLFEKDGKGYYRYDSDTNYAWYSSDTGGGNFVVYDKTYTVRYPGVQINPVGFVPFNQYDEANTNISPSGPLNHHFGLTMTTNFKIPKDAKVDGEDMVFDFSGDDDVWVFVDGVLVLDIGGVHDKRTGSINFATGNVDVDLVAPVVPGRPETIQTIGGHSTLSDIFARQGLTFDNSTGSTHSLAFFFVERGGYLSNMSLKFNLPTVQDPNEPVPEPEPQPEPEPNPQPDPEPTPDPQPNPDPVPDPSPNPAPETPDQPHHPTVHVVDKQHEAPSASDAPQTGDEGLLAGAGLLGGLSALAAAAAALARRFRMRHEH